MKKRTAKIMELFDENLGTQFPCGLEYSTPYQLLFATIMSAQCTDKRVNIVTRDLFVKYPTLESFAGASLEELEEDIRTTGFYHNKAKNIIASARILLAEYGGEVPSDIDELTALPGVGRKTANVVRGNVYDIPSVVVDTHVKRVSRRLGLTKSEDPVVIEKDLMKEYPEDHWILINHQFMEFGRNMCTARAPKCERCFAREYCKNGK
ncbi:MAG: endonuclease III [Eubacterium sp.]|nr:endonuclease III [Eubacterium sp.]